MSFPMQRTMEQRGKLRQGVAWRGAPTKGQRKKSTQELHVPSHRMPLSSIGLEVWITKRQKVPNVLVPHTVREAIDFVFRDGPASSGFVSSDGPLLPRAGAGREARDGGQHEATGHPHCDCGGGPGESGLFFPPFSTHENQRALAALRCLSSWNTVSALISVSAGSTRSHYAKI